MVRLITDEDRIFGVAASEKLDYYMQKLRAAIKDMTFDEEKWFRSLDEPAEAWERFKGRHNESQ